MLCTAVHVVRMRARRGNGPRFFVHLRDLTGRGTVVYYLIVEL